MKMLITPEPHGIFCSNFVYYYISTRLLFDFPDCNCVSIPVKHARVHGWHTRHGHLQVRCLTRGRSLFWFINYMIIGSYEGRCVWHHLCLDIVCDKIQQIGGELKKNNNGVINVSSGLYQI